ncbi:NAD(P)-dependent glycerol-3-phosphate dehydrogenase [Thiotrichales bacterium 19S3-7]|nr:NAD(P)-dependent glycerol-3-phosphate dehydrogenase [Thiotrichales bacterium 19S3-7]MCF6802730.1 NAD(P)-dependent glycerol-3-phosphate dehydrogenase [Thiotrichales bacterium 19S3-11]
MANHINNEAFLVLGAGSWGSALAIHLASLTHQVMLYCHDPVQAKLMQSDRINRHYLPESPFPDTLSVTYDFKAYMAQIKHILIAVPSNAFKSVLTQIIPYLSRQHTVLWATKGLCSKEHRLLSEVAKDLLPTFTPYGVITGPSFAKEVAKHLPTAVLVASNQITFAQQMQSLWTGNYFRCYISDDLIGAQVGGAVKNVLAIAVGISDGLGFGSNAKAALITRGLAEMTRFGLKLGAQKETISGLACLGDLVLTCTDNQSRNRRFGLLLGQGESKNNAINQIGQVVEGYETTEHIYYLAKKLTIEMPIVNQTYAVLYQDKNPLDAVNSLMGRELKTES